MPLVVACAGGQSETKEADVPTWGTASVEVINPIAPEDTLCYQIKLELDTLAAGSELAQGLSAALCKSMSSVRECTTVQAAMEAMADSIKASWEKEMVDFYEPQSDMNFRLQYQHELCGEPVDNGREDILSYKTNTYTYQGGAHGGTMLRLFNFEKQTGKLLTLEDLVPAGKEEEVLKALEMQLCKDYDAKDLFELQNNTGIAMMGDLFLPSNFLLKGDSVQFLFNQYEIAPYAAGIIKVTIPLPANP